MLHRKVTHVKKDSSGTITHLCNPGIFDWGCETVQQVLSHLDNKTHRYFVREHGIFDVDVVPVGSGANRYVRTTADATDSNNLENLPTIV